MSPPEHFRIGQIAATNPSSLRLRNQDRVQRRFSQGTWVHAVQAHLLGFGQFCRSKLDEVPLQSNVRQACGPGQHLEVGHGKQIHGRWRQLAIPVDQFSLHLGNGFNSERSGQLPVCLQAQPLPRHVVVWEMGVDGQLNLHLCRPLLTLATEVSHGLAHQSDVKVKANTLNVAGLLPA